MRARRCADACLAHRKPRNYDGGVLRDHDARDRRAWRVFLTEEVEPAMRSMRAIAAEVRRDALTGLATAERERFVDTLLAIKANLTKLENAAPGNGGARRRTP